MIRFAVSALTFASICSWAQPLATQTINPEPTRIVGHATLQLRTANPNLVEGREFLSPRGIAIDASASPAVLYVADTGNNRILGWRDARSFANGSLADFVIGQADLYSTLTRGESGRLTGLTAPSGLAVDRNGNLYVVDTGNNRILRYRRPYADPEPFKNPDMVIGQSGFEGNAANRGSAVPGAATVATARSTETRTASLAFDSAGNLWFTDPLNHRVLRFPAAALAAGANGPSADLVLGQATFDAAAGAPNTAAARTAKSASGGSGLLRFPSGVAVDNAGRVYVSDELRRVLVFVPSPALVSGQPAARLMGIEEAPRPPQAVGGRYSVGSAESVLVVDNRPLVIDSGFHRILRYDPFEQWPAERIVTNPQGQVVEAVISPDAKAVIGQPNFDAVQPNLDQPEPDAPSFGNGTLRSPSAAAVLGSELFVVDSGNNRVIVYNGLENSSRAVRLLGQPAFGLSAPNQIDGREFFIADRGAVAIDRRGPVPHLYVADTFNNRILGFRDARRLKLGDRADLVIGQVDFQRNLANAPSNRANQPSESGLFLPSGLAVDSDGSLWVADTGNGRVLRFPYPFGTPAGQPVRPNLVLGQNSFISRFTDPSARNMAAPYGIALTAQGDVLVSDAAHNRVLMFRKPAGGDFSNGQPAAFVIGQPDFLTADGRTGLPNRFVSPRHIAVDRDDRLYVTDYSNNRVLIYAPVKFLTANDPAPVFTLTGFNGPTGIFVSRVSDEIWVTNQRVSGSAIFRFRPFDQLPINSTPDTRLNAFGPTAIELDEGGAVYVLDGANRLGIYYNLFRIENAGSYANLRPFAPGMYVAFRPITDRVIFTDREEVFSTVPAPRTLADVQVLVNDQPIPLIYAGPAQINALLPQSLPLSGTAEVQIVRASTGQVLAAGQIPLAEASPALFTADATGEGQLAAVNLEDGTINSQTNRASRGQFIALFGTGQGPVPGAPADGEAAPGPLPTLFKPRVLIGTAFVPEENIQYSGLTPTLINVWQINVKIPNDVVPGPRVPVVVQLNSINSNIGRNGRIIQTTIAVK